MHCAHHLSPTVFHVSWYGLQGTIVGSESMNEPPTCRFEIEDTGCSVIVRCLPAKSGAGPKLHFKFDVRGKHTISTTMPLVQVVGQDIAESLELSNPYYAEKLRNFIIKHRYVNSYFVMNM